MSSRLWPALGLAAVVTMVAVWRWPSGEAPALTPPVVPAHAAAVATPDAPGPTAGARAAPAPAEPRAFNPASRPALPTPVVPEPARLPPAAFAAESRDDRWARPLEADLQRRLITVPTVHADAIECRSTTCKLALSGPADAVSTAFESLAALHAPLTLTGAGSAVTAYLTFPPPAAPTDPD